MTPEMHELMREQIQTFHQASATITQAITKLTGDDVAGLNTSTQIAFQLLSELVRQDSINVNLLHLIASEVESLKVDMQTRSMIVDAEHRQATLQALNQQIELLKEL